MLQNLTNIMKNPLFSIIYQDLQYNGGKNFEIEWRDLNKILKIVKSGVITSL